MEWVVFLVVAGCAVAFAAGLVLRPNPLHGALFLGGWQVPWLFSSGFHFPGGLTWTLPHLWVVVLQVGAFIIKVCAMIWFLMLIRWTLPRFRYDQAMRLGWLSLLPLSILNIVLTAGVLLL